ncbi:helix-turn-helix domain-containing protein [Pedobacter psychroterrae]|uniref:AraC family transcriptional regulator n=1 Tax=Pedobacter psychroterrae TaxID=2530453 RepID=A0A4R0NSR8_9SPHI|nr:AraC family transcriptional regulator [Pedobacter psychroterrae]TCD03179.1 AraC family transcriptional regulator [Pedobacter psychroterrae]
MNIYKIIITQISACKQKILSHLGQFVWQNIHLITGTYHNSNQKSMLVAIRFATDVITFRNESKSVTLHQICFDMDDIITLPHTILEMCNHPDNPLFLYRHISNKPSLKNKILLKQNLISLLCSGEKVLNHANQTISICPDQFVILSACNCLMTEKLSSDHSYQSILFFFDNDSLSKFLLKYRMVFNEIKGKFHEQQSPIIVLDKDDFIKNYTLSLSLMINKDKLSIPIDMIELKFEELLLYILRTYPQRFLSFCSAVQKEKADFELKSVVEQHITSQVTVEDLAFLCNTSVSTFKRRFFKMFGSSPNQYFKKRKMEIASNLLLRNLDPSEIFYQVGYESHSSFSQTFKQVFGISPKKFQRENLKR